MDEDATTCGRRSASVEEDPLEDPHVIGAIAQNRRRAFRKDIRVILAFRARKAGREKHGATLEG